MYYCYTYPSPVGKITVASNEKSIVGLWIEKQKYYMDVLENKAYQEKETDAIRLAKVWLDKYFNNEKPPIDGLPMEFIGSDFRKQIWRILAEIPYGEVITYGDVAKQIAKEKGLAAMSAQAVGGAVGRNPISIIIPCHRVVGANGSLTGYAGGIDIKTRLLAFEGADMSKLYAPTKGTAL
ncbi:MAG: methylated-DNA--[Oscillospiraceae bacterium]|nr:methylated-DNA--[protein]-cysteine S-methyltransferase [Oscillospiraceae bacterium]